MRHGAILERPLVLQARKAAHWQDHGRYRAARLTGLSGPPDAPRPVRDLVQALTATKRGPIIMEWTWLPWLPY